MEKVKSKRGQREPPRLPQQYTQIPRKSLMLRGMSSICALRQELVIEACQGQGESSESFPVWAASKSRGKLDAICNEATVSKDVLKT